MPSFDIVSEVDMHELTNAIDQANREISQRFDFKGSDAKFELVKEEIKLSSSNDFQIKQMFDILIIKLSKRGVDTKSLDIGEIQKSLHQATQTIKVKQGIDQPAAKEINKLLKESGLKVQSSIQGDKVRVTGKKRDDLQDAIAFLRKQELAVAVQFNNFRD